MRCSKRGFLCISFSLFFTVTYAASSAFPGHDGFTPFPPDQEMQEEDFSASQEPEDFPDKDFLDGDLPDKDNFPPEEPPVKPPSPPHRPKEADKIYYYRGNRTYSEELPLKVSFIRCLKGEDEELIILIMFNQSVNPRSISHESFLIDDKELPENIRFSFNKKGDTIKMILYQEDEDFIITVQNICAFTGECIEPVDLLVKVED